MISMTAWIARPNATYQRHLGDMLLTVEQHYDVFDPAAARWEPGPWIWEVQFPSACTLLAHGTATQRHEAMTAAERWATERQAAR